MGFSLTKIKVIYNTLSHLGASRLTTRLFRDIRYRFIYPSLGGVIFRTPSGSYGDAPATFSSVSFPGALAAGDTLLREADEFRRRTFAFLNLPRVTFAQKIDWQCAPVQDPLWQYCLHYGEWALTLSQAFRLTRDERYREALISLIADWIEHNPPGSTPGWEPYPLSRRLVAWSKVAMALWQDAAWRSFWQVSLAPSLHQQVRGLAANLEKDLANNHLLANYRALAWMGLVFPGWPEAAQWRNSGLAGLWGEMDRQVLADGVHDERSISYHAIVLADLLETWEFCARTGLSVPQDTEKKLSLMIGFLRNMQAPDGGYPMLNDTVPGYPDYLHAETRADYWPRFPFKDEGADLARPEPDNGATAYRQAGYVILRSGPGDFFCFDAGPMGPGHLPGHGHADALSFVLYASHRPIIIDPGVYSYHDRAWRDHFRSTGAHNTVCVDGRNQCVFWGPFRVAYQPKAHLLSWSEEHVEGEHEGYLRLKDPVLHRRKIKKLEGKHWEVQDYFTGQGEHEFALSLQMAPEARVKREGGTDFSMCWPGVKLHIMVPHPAPGSFATIEPGWVSPGWNLKVEAPRYVLKWRAGVPAENLLLLTIED